jgi:hypothetical protein
MPSDRLAERIYELFRRAAPEQMHTIPELVTKAQENNISDDEVLNMLCHRWQVSRDGWPLDPVQRRRMRVERFLENNCPSEMIKADLIVKQSDYTDDELIASLASRYKRDELGDPLDPEERLKENLNRIFRCCAPEKIGMIPELLKQRQRKNWQHDEFLRMVCDQHRVGLDGWPNHPVDRRRARLNRFFLTNAPEELRKVEHLCQAPCTEADIFRELYDRFQRDEFGNPVASRATIREKLEGFFKVAAPEDTGNTIETLIQYQGQRKLTDDDLMLLVQRQYNATSEGWPADPQERLRARVTRFFLSNYPEEAHKIDSLCNLRGVSEDEVMSHLYTKYGHDEFGTPFENTKSTGILKEKLYEFYEQYVPEEDLEQLVKQAIGLGLPEEELFKLLNERYQGIKKKPNALRSQVQLIYARAAPESVNQMHQLFKLKREEKLEDKEVIKALCDKYNVDTDGWPKDTARRRRRRLILFFKNNDPSRLGEVDEICPATLPESTEEGTPSEDRSALQPSPSATLDTATEALTEKTLDEVETDASGQVQHWTAAQLATLTEEKLFRRLFAEYKKDELGAKVKKKKKKSKAAKMKSLVSEKLSFLNLKKDDSDEESEASTEDDETRSVQESVSAPASPPSAVAADPEKDKDTPSGGVSTSAFRNTSSSSQPAPAPLTAEARLMQNAQSLREFQHDLVENHGGFSHDRLTIDNPHRGFIPGMSQVWPPPQIDSLEALYKTDLMKDLLRKYGGSAWSPAMYDTHSDPFARLCRKFDEPSLPTEAAEHFFNPPPVAFPPIPLRSHLRKDTFANSDSMHSQPPGSGFLSSDKFIGGKESQLVSPITALNLRTDRTVRLCRSIAQMTEVDGREDDLRARYPSSPKRTHSDRATPAAFRSSAPVGHYFVKQPHSQLATGVTVEDIQRAALDDASSSDTLRRAAMEGERQQRLLELVGQVPAMSMAVAGNSKENQSPSAFGGRKPGNEERRLLFVEEELEQKQLQLLAFDSRREGTTPVASTPKPAVTPVRWGSSPSSHSNAMEKNRSRQDVPQQQTRSFAPTFSLPVAAPPESSSSTRPLTASKSFSAAFRRNTNARVSDQPPQQWMATPNSNSESSLPIYSPLAGDRPVGAGAKSVSFRL